MRYLKLTALEVEKMCDRLAEKVKEKFKPDCIVGVGRGGWVPAVYLSDRLGVKKLYGVKVDFYEGERRGRKPVVSQKLPINKIKGKVLVVDDVADTGETLIVVKKMLENAKEVKTATLHYKPHSKVKPDFFVQKTKRWIIYPYQTCEMGR
ncbi:MAG: phosphoribosyltransferase [Candidatus Micrarchaeia archaeon]